jgi:diguanylate cyclase (GGDEF)-like protein
MASSEAVTPSEPVPEAGPKPDARFQDWREKVLNRVLPLACLGGLVAFVNVLVQADFRVAGQVAGALAYGALFVCLGVIMVWHGLGPARRSWVFLVTLYLAAVVSFWRAGIMSDGFMYALDASILAFTLISLRAGMFFCGLSFVTYLGFLGLAQAGALSAYAVYGQNPWDLRYWSANAIALAASLAVIIYVLARFTAFNLHSLRQAQKTALKLATANKQLDEINQHLEQTVAQRTQELRESNQNLKALAMHDSLTGLPNRLLLYDRIRQTILVCHRNHLRFALLFIDMDDFKTINDTHGHDVGDQFLVAVAQIFKNIVRDSDTVARLGGDEFILILRNAQSPQAVERVVHEIMQHFVAPVRLGPLAIQTSVSIGICLYPDHATDPETLIQKADTAMYAVKATAKNGYQYGA